MTTKGSVVFVVVAWECYGDESWVDSVWSAEEPAMERARELTPKRTGIRQSKGAYVHDAIIDEG